MFYPYILLKKAQAFVQPFSFFATEAVTLSAWCGGLYGACLFLVGSFFGFLRLCVYV